MIETIKNLANIAFFLVIALVTVLSYLHARKTLFAPIRTETFKLQLKAFEEVLLYFQNRSESDFLEAFDLSRVTALNTLKMADAYVNDFFSEEISLDPDERKKTYEVLIGGLVSVDYMKKYFTKVEPKEAMLPSQAGDERIRSPAIILAKWQKYEHGMVEYTREYNDQMKELERLAASPILPKTLRDHIGEFRNIAHESLTTIGKTVAEAAKQMPDHFPRAGDMSKFSPSWVWNEFNDKRKHFEPTAKKILDFMNGYLKVEDLMK